jgi:hypothetical protein
MESVWIWGLVASQGVALAGYAAVLIRWRRRIEAHAAAQAANVRDAQAQSLLAELRSQGVALQTLALALERLEAQLLLEGRHAAPATQRGGRSAYELAIRLANSGASIDEVCASCGMSRSEAELLVRLHRAGNSPSMSRRLAMAG